MKRGWDAHVLGEAPHRFRSAPEALRKLREEDPKASDQYLPPFVVVDGSGEPVGPARLAGGDTVRVEGGLFGVAPGQSAVLYDGEGRVLCGGVIGDFGEG